MKKYFKIFILFLIVGLFCYGLGYGYRIPKPITFTNLSDPTQINQLNQTLTDLWDITNGRYHINIVTSNPDGSLRGIIGEIVLFNNSGTYYLEVNTDGGTIWRGIALSNTP